MQKLNFNLLITPLSVEKGTNSYPVCSVGNIKQVV
jgi:hypothetical protein